MEEVLGMTSEYQSIGTLWSAFHLLMRGQTSENSLDHESVSSVPSGLPGTGGYILPVKSEQQQ